MKQITQWWVGKAEGDYKVCVREAGQADSVDDLVCFHAQQCVEKYFKAVLVENDISFGKTHNLIFLLGKLSSIIPELLKYKGDLAWLTGFSVLTRYPVYDATSGDSRKSVRMMKRIRKTLRKHLRL